MSPFDATAQVMKERMEAGEMKSTAATMGARTASASAATSAIISEDDEPGTRNSKEKSPDEPASPKKRGGLAFWKRGKSNKKNSDNKEEVETKEAASRSLASTPAAVTTAAAVAATSAVATATIPVVTPTREKGSEIEFQDSSDDEENGDDEVVQGFAKSGINYYDAVRRDRSNEEGFEDDDDEEDHDARNRQTRSRGNGIKFPRIGFSKLSKNESVDDNEGNKAARAAPIVQPHVTIPSPTRESEFDQDVEEQLRSSPPAMPQKDSDVNGLPRPIPVKPDSPPRDATADRGIPETMSGDSLLTEDTTEKESRSTAYLREEKKADDGDAMEDAMTAKLLGVSRAISAEEPPRMQPHVELDIDTYLNSTETLSQFGGTATSFDHASVVSGKSYRTSHTAGTNHTQSTRTRRPGQAKIRIEKEKRTKQNKPTGWQESIQAVAAKTGRMWDPEHGWIDYVDPNISANEDSMSAQLSEKIHVPVDKLKKSRVLLPEDDEYQTGSPVQVPFPQDWDEERSGMLQGDSSSAPSTPRHHPTTHSRKSKNPKVVSPPRDGKPRGWVETMKAATANINAEGKRWDPEKGWVKTDSQAFQVNSGHEDRAYLEQVAVVADSDTQDFGTIKAVPAVPASSSNACEPTVEQLDAIADQNQDSGLQFLSEEEDQPTEDDVSASRSMDTKSLGRYVQIKDTGSIQSHYRNPATKDQIQKRQMLSSEDSIPENEVAAVSRSMLSTATSPGTKLILERMGQVEKGGSPMVVKREAMNKKDAALFSESHPRNERRSGPVDLDEIFDEEMSAMNEEQNEQQLLQQSLSRDQSDIYDQGTNDSFAQQQDFSWDEEDTKEHSSHHQRPVPRLKINIRDPASGRSAPYAAKSTGTASEASFGSMSTSSRSIPKLRGPKRDSSPIHGERQSRSKRNAQPVSQSEGATTITPQSSPEMNSRYQNEQNYEQSRQISKDRYVQERYNDQMSPRFVRHHQDDDDDGYQLDPQGEMQNHAEGKVERNLSGAPLNDSMPPPSSKRQIPPNPYHDDSPASVRDLHSYWEARSNTPSDANSAEWKSFLVKKVQAEAAAAATTQQRTRNGREGEKDTIFDFDGSEGVFPTPPTQRASRGMSGRPGEPQEGAFDDISDLSPIRHDDDSDFVASEASTNIQQPTTFLQRLQACAAPIVTKGTENCGPGVPMAAHLAFLRNNPTVGGSPEKHAMSAGMCGRPDVIVEEDDEENDEKEDSSEKKNDAAPSLEKSRSRSNPRSRQKDDVSSVISDEFGAKTAYFEALAMKAAVSGGSKKKKRRSPGSDVSSSTSSQSKHSEKFQQFLDRRASKSSDSQQPPQQQQMPNKKPPTGRQEVSNRAERYASEKMEEMMEHMAEQPNNNSSVPLDYRGRPMEEETGAFPTLPRPPTHKNQVASSRLAAEELAAARVEAMMRNLSAQNLDGEEGEI
jgi:hypothetical protein